MKIPIPRRLQERPQWKGLPIPYVTLVRDDGSPDFRVTDEAKRLQVIGKRLCQLCGHKLGRWFFFAGGTEAARNNTYFEPACHLDCLIYAMQVCPFIVGKVEHVPLAKIQELYHKETEIGRVVTSEGSPITVREVDNVLATRNPYWVIKKANGWLHRRTDAGTVLLVPDVVLETKPLHAETMSAADWSVVMTELEKEPAPKPQRQRYKLR